MRKLLLLVMLSSLVIHGMTQAVYKEITLPALMKLKQDGKKNIIILDVRSTGEYTDTVPGGRQIGIGRIKGAINVPIQDLQQKPAALEGIQQYKDEEIYVICSHSYRSRRVTNLLLEKGFTNVTNVKVGMSDWYRNYDALEPFMVTQYENNIQYSNLAPSALYKILEKKDPVQMIAFSSAPRGSFDTMVSRFYPFFPSFHKVPLYTPADSLKILDLVKAGTGKKWIFYNTVGIGAAETAEWLSKKGFTNVYHLQANIGGYVEYLLNYQDEKSFYKHFDFNSAIQFHSPHSFCKSKNQDAQIVDMRHDTVFNKITTGTRINYKTLKGAVNFPYYKNAAAFEQSFPDKNKYYLLLGGEFGYTGIALADELVKKGYQIGWIIGGIERWEWYANNVEEFGCGGMLDD